MAFRIAVSGLNAAQAALDITGNNIANNNTVGFKESRANFADVYAVSTFGTSRDAIGQGVQLTAVAQQFSQGNITFTDNSLDMAVNGEGFFVLDDAGSRAYSRAGQFGVDKDGFIVNSTNQRLIGLGASGGVVSGTTGPLQLATSVLAPQPTTGIELSVILDSREDIKVLPFDVADSNSYNDSTPIQIYDSLGNDHEARLFFRKTADNTWDTHMVIGGDDTQTTAVQTLVFDNSGALQTNMPVSFGGFSPGGGADPLAINVDLTGTAQYGSPFGVQALSQNGSTTGRLSGIDINEAGVVLARFSNGQTQPQGQVVLANFGNPQGLTPAGETNWTETSSSGPPLIGVPGSTSLGLLQSGAIEESNVDLSSELVNMIVAQRNFQANAQMIRTEDEVTQTIINIR